MTQPNPTTRPPAPNVQIIDGRRIKFESVDLSEGFGILAACSNALCGFRDADWQDWQPLRLHYIHPTAKLPYKTTVGEDYKQCARMIDCGPAVTASDTELLDKLDAYGMTLGNGSQCWNIQTDPGDPLMTVREAIQAMGGEE